MSDPNAPDENDQADDQAETPETEAEVATEDPVENTGAGEPADTPAPEPPAEEESPSEPEPESPPEPEPAAASDIEAAAEAAAAADPAPPEPPPEPDPEPEPEPEAEAIEGKAPASKRVARKPRTADKSTAQIQAHLAKLKENRPEPPAKPEPSAAELDAEKAKAAKRQELDEIAAELAEMAERKAALEERQQEILNPVVEADTMTQAERIKGVQAAGTQIRRQRANDRLRLLAKSAGKSPIDQALGDRPRNRPDLEPPGTSDSTG